MSRPKGSTNKRGAQSPQYVNAKLAQDGLRQCIECGGILDANNKHFRVVRIQPTVDTKDLHYTKRKYNEVLSNVCLDCELRELKAAGAQKLTLK